MGKFYLSSEKFNMDFKPAVNINVSIPRIGSDAQFKMIKKVSKNIKIKIINYYEMLVFLCFNDFIDKETKKIINHCEILTEIFKQDRYSPYSCVK